MRKANSNLFTKNFCTIIAWRYLKNHFIIIPSINLNHSIKKFTVNNRKEKGKFVKSDFEYHSGTNINFLNVNQIKKLLALN